MYIHPILPLINKYHAASYLNVLDSVNCSTYIISDADSLFSVCKAQAGQVQQIVQPICVISLLGKGFTNTYIISLFYFSMHNLEIFPLQLFPFKSCIDSRIIAITLLIFAKFQENLHNTRFLQLLNTHPIYLNRVCICNRSKFSLTIR